MDGPLLQYDILPPQSVQKVLKDGFIFPIGNTTAPMAAATCTRLALYRVGWAIMSMATVMARISTSS